MLPLSVRRLYLDSAAAATKEFGLGLRGISILVAQAVSAAEDEAVGEFEEENGAKTDPNTRLAFSVEASSPKSSNNPEFFFRLFCWWLRFDVKRYETGRQLCDVYRVWSSTSRSARWIRKSCRS